MAQSSDNDVANKVLMPTMMMMMMMMMMTTTTTTMMMTAMIYHSIIIILYYCCYRYLSLLLLLSSSLSLSSSPCSSFLWFPLGKEKNSKDPSWNLQSPFRDTTSKRAKAARNIWSCLGGMDRYWGCTLPKFHMEPEKLPSWATNISPDIPWKSPYFEDDFFQTSPGGICFKFPEKLPGPNRRIIVFLLHHFSGASC